GPHLAESRRPDRPRRGLAHPGPRRGREVRRRNAGRRQPRLPRPPRLAGPLLLPGAGLLHDADAVQPVPEVGARMIGLLHRLKKDEEGQALVLGAIFGLVLALCVLSTVGLGRAVYDKMQLQTAADAAAYSQAAVEARVLNFTAYTNRAMVVHYASIMAARAFLTWVHFLWSAIKPPCEVLQFVPYVGVVVRIIEEVMQALIAVLDWGVALLTPILAAATTVL